MTLKALLEVLADGQFHSGEALGERLGVSRSAVWKQLKKLPELGIELYSVKGRGYRIPGGLDLLCEHALQQGLRSDVAQQIRQVQLDLLTTSTNAVALKAAQAGPSHGHLYLAERQSEGRGRRGRDWYSPFSGQLCFSLVWSFSQGAAALEGLSLVVGLAMARGLKACGASPVALKWPNDLLCQGGKLGGILLEMTGDASGQCQVVIGVGINVNMPKEAARQIDQPWVDLRTLLGVAPARTVLAAAVLNELVPCLQEFERSGFAPFRDEWQSLHAYTGRRVRLQTSTLAIGGICRGVDQAGGLLIETSEGVQAYHGGEISMRSAE